MGQYHHYHYHHHHHHYHLVSLALCPLQLRPLLLERGGGGQGGVAGQGTEPRPRPGRLAREVVSEGLLVVLVAASSSHGRVRDHLQMDVISGVIASVKKCRCHAHLHPREHRP